MSNTGYIPAAVRGKVSVRDRGVCRHCGKRAERAAISKRGILQFFDEADRVFHLDHVVPASRGGSATVENMVLACADCNLGKRRSVAANDYEIVAILGEFASGVSA